jgi:hypothetical protein
MLRRHAGKPCFAAGMFLKQPATANAYSINPRGRFLILKGEYCDDFGTIHNLGIGIYTFRKRLLSSHARHFSVKSQGIWQQATPAAIKFKGLSLRKET